MTRDTYKALMVAVTMCEMPIGTKVQLKDDYPGITHIIDGYQLTAQGSYMEFRDGTKLDLTNMEQIEIVEVY